MAEGFFALPADLEPPRREPPFLGSSLRQTPANLQAEQSLLGALLANNRAFERVGDFLEPKHFSDPVHGRIYTEIRDCILTNRLADAVTLKNRFEASGTLAEVGGVPYLAQLLSSMVGIINAGEYGREILDTWTRRQLIDIGERAVNNAFGADPALDPVAQIAMIEGALAQLSGSARRGDQLLSFGEAFDAAMADVEEAGKSGKSPSLLTGMPTIDAALGGFWPETLVLLAGLPKSGKTGLAVQIAELIGARLRDEALTAGREAAYAAQQPGVVIFSMEMRAKELALRSAARRFNLPLQKLMRGEIDLLAAADLVNVSQAVGALPVRIHDCRRMPLRLLAPKIRLHLQRRRELLVIVDHLLILADDDTARSRGGQDASTVARAAGDLKTLAQETGLPFLVLTHATRASGKDGNRRPVASDIKWAGEGDADIVVFVHRPIMNMDSTPPEQNLRESDTQFQARRNHWYGQRDGIKDLAEIVLAAGRQAASGVWRMRFRGETVSFHEWREPAVAAPEWVTADF